MDHHSRKPSALDIFARVALVVVACCLIILFLLLLKVATG